MFRAKFPLTSSSGRRAGAGFRSHPSFRREDSLQPGHLIRTPGAPGSPCPWHPIPEGRPIRHLRLPDSAENAGIPVLRVHRERGSTDPRVRGERRRTCPQVPQRIQDGREQDSGCFYRRAGGSGTANSPRALPQPPAFGFRRECRHTALGFPGERRRTCPQVPQGIQDGSGTADASTYGQEGAGQRTLPAPSRGRPGRGSPPLSGRIRCGSGGFREVKKKK